MPEDLLEVDCDHAHGHEFPGLSGHQHLLQSTPIFGPLHFTGKDHVRKSYRNVGSKCNLISRCSKFNRPSHQPGMKAKILVGPSQQRQYRCPPLAVQHVQLCSLCQRHCAPHPAMTRTLILQPPCCTAHSRTHEPMWCFRFVSFRNCRLMSNIAAIRDIRFRIPPARAPGLPLPHPPPLHVSVSAAVVSPPTQRCS